MTIYFTVPGIPVPRNSQKVSVRNGQVRQYLPQHVVDFKSRVSAYAKMEMHKRKLPIQSGMLILEARFIFPAPKSGLSKLERAALAMDEIACISYAKIRADLDNLLKAVGDSLQGIVFENDKQIVDATLRKRIGSVPRTEIIIRSI